MASTSKSTSDRGNPSLRQDPQPARPRDIDYAAQAVRSAMMEKFGRQNELDDLQVVAGEQSIRVEHQGQAAAGTRDDLLAAIRNSADYASLWKELQTSQRFDR
jgi:hypothetical protein